MPNEKPPVNAFKKGHKKVGGRPPGRRNILTNDLKEALLEAATRVGFVREVDVLDADGKPTGRKVPEWDGDGGLAGYLEWAAVYQPGHFIPQLGKVMPIQINAVARTEMKTVVRYETVEERRQAMIAKGWSPAVLEAMEAAMEPKFIQEQRRKQKKLRALPPAVAMPEPRAPAALVRRKDRRVLHRPRPTRGIDPHQG
jgi:hypothetical protein